MFDVKTVSMEWGGKTLTLETGRIARQADGAVLATYGETVVLCAVTAAKSVKDLRIGEVVKQDVTVENGKVIKYRVRLNISFKYAPGK